MGYVYSTDQEFDLDDENKQDIVTLPNQDQKLKLRIEKKGRAGKIVTIINNFVGNDDDLKSLAKRIKNKFSVGGNSKNGEIVIQGNIKDKIKGFLLEEKYKVKG